MELCRRKEGGGTTPGRGDLRVGAEALFRLPCTLTLFINLSCPRVWFVYPFHRTPPAPTLSSHRGSVLGSPHLRVRHHLLNHAQLRLLISRWRSQPHQGFVRSVARMAEHLVPEYRRGERTRVGCRTSGGQQGWIPEEALGVKTRQGRSTRGVLAR
jgi:hypothetical protein